MERAKLIKVEDQLKSIVYRTKNHDYFKKFMFIQKSKSM